MALGRKKAAESVKNPQKSAKIRDEIPKKRAVGIGISRFQLGLGSLSVGGLFSRVLRGLAPRAGGERPRVHRRGMGGSAADRVGFSGVAVPVPPLSVVGVGAAPPPRASRAAGGGAGALCGALWLGGRARPARASQRATRKAKGDRAIAPCCFRSAAVSCSRQNSVGSVAARQLRQMFARSCAAAFIVSQRRSNGGSSHS